MYKTSTHFSLLKCLVSLDHPHPLILPSVKMEPWGLSTSLPSTSIENSVPTSPTTFGLLSNLEILSESEDLRDRRHSDSHPIDGCRRQKGERVVDVSRTPFRDYSHCVSTRRVPCPAVSLSHTSPPDPPLSVTRRSGETRQGQPRILGPRSECEGPSCRFSGKISLSRHFLFFTSV